MGKRRRPGQGKKSVPRPEPKAAVEEAPLPQADEPIYVQPTSTIQFDQDPMVLWSALTSNGAWEVSIRSGVQTPFEGHLSVHNTKTGTRIHSDTVTLSEAEVYSGEYAQERQDTWQNAALHAIETRKSHDTRESDTNRT